MKSAPPQPPPRPKMEVSQELVNDLLKFIENQFYLDVPKKRFHQDRNFLLKRVVLWPAAWLHKRGVTLPPDRYKQILVEIFLDICRHGSTSAVSYWPGYLAKCVQDHFYHQGEKIYESAKSARTLAENAILIAGKIQCQPAPDPVAELAKAAALVKSPGGRRRPRPDSAPVKQANLEFGF